MLKDKYIHTEKDKEDDMLFIKEFTLAFEEKFKHQLKLEVYNDDAYKGGVNPIYCVIMDGLRYGAQTIYSSIVENCTEMIWLKTNINPNGHNDGSIARTFNIQYNKEKGGKQVSKFYGYSLTINEINNKFDIFLNGTINEDINARFILS